MSDSCTLYYKGRDRQILPTCQNATDPLGIPFYSPVSTRGVIVDKAE